MKKLEYHPLSDYFPMLPESEFEQLKESIAAFGLLEPITLLDGMILDGRNRYEACWAVGIEPHFREYGSDGHTPLEFVVAANMRRRHLTEAQKAQIIIDVEGIPKVTKGGRPTKTGNASPVLSQAELARKAGVSKGTIASVAEVQDRPALKEKLRSGQITAREASRERMKESIRKAEIVPTWQGLYAKAPRANEIVRDLGRIINGAERWLSNEFGLTKIDPKGHTPLLLKRIDQAIEALERFREALEDLSNG